MKIRATVICEEDRHILLVRKPKSRWALPGGTVERGEHVVVTGREQVAFQREVAFDVVIGTALACGGYAMALVVYIMNRGQYHPLVRPALLTSAFGYTIAGVSVVLDLVGQLVQPPQVVIVEAQRAVQMLRYRRPRSRFR